MAGERSTPFDPQEWHNVQPPESMDISRRFEYDEDHLQLLRKWLRLDEPNTIVEIGCGSGFFTEKLAAISPESEITGIEPDEVLRKYVEGKGIKRAKFIKGSAEEIPLPTGFADLTVCHIVLYNLPNVPMAVAEMARVTRDGGIVAAIKTDRKKRQLPPRSPSQRAIREGPEGLRSGHLGAQVEGDVR